MYSNIAIVVSSGTAFLISLLAIKGKEEKKHDKLFTYLAIGLGLWFSAESIYSYYQISCKVDIAYPTIADFFWVAGYFFLGMHLYRTFKVWNETKKVKYYPIIIASVISAILVGNHIYLNYFAQEVGPPEAGTDCIGPLQQIPNSAAVFDFSYFLADGIILIPALVILFSLRIKDPFFLHRILISIAVITVFIADILFIDYAGNYVVFYDMFYDFGYICFAMALLWYYKLSQLLNKNIDYCIKESADLIKRSEKFIDTDTTELEETNGTFEIIQDPKKAYDHLINLVRKASNEIQLLLPAMALTFMVKNRDIYDLLLEKSKQSDMSVKMLLPYDLAIEQHISRLNEDSRYMIKIQFIRGESIPNQIVFLIDNKFVFIITLNKNKSTEDIEYATYSNKESVLLCYISLIEYQSLMSEI